MGVGDSKWLLWILLWSEVATLLLGNGTWTYVSLQSKTQIWHLQATFAAMSCGIFTMRPVFRTPNYRPFRSAMYGVLGLSIFIPAIHGLLLHGWALQNNQMSLTYFMGLGILNGTGTTIYTARIPEKWHPRRFDIYGSSHQIMHFWWCGAFSHTIGLVKAFDYWQNLRTMDGGACPRIWTKPVLGRPVDRPNAVLPVS